MDRYLETKSLLQDQYFASFESRLEFQSRGCAGQNLQSNTYTWTRLLGFFTACFDRPPLEVGKTMEDWDEGLKTEIRIHDTQFLVVSHGATIVGCLAYHYNKDELSGFTFDSLETLDSYNRAHTYAHLQFIGVKQYYQRMGIGTTMVSHLLRHLRESGVEMVYLLVDEHNLPAISWYQSLGFIQYASKNTLYSSRTGRVQKKFLYCKKITPSKRILIGWGEVTLSYGQTSSPRGDH
jgi:ribosomal protein S18 acetylase RimI-like enzyme